jgi:hypothetical protein
VAGFEHVTSHRKLLFQRHQSVREPMMSIVPEEESLQSLSSITDKFPRNVF